MKLIVLIAGILLYFTFALQNAVKGITYPKNTTVTVAQKKTPAKVTQAYAKINDQQKQAGFTF